jgi:hypothetical protein
MKLTRRSRKAVPLGSQRGRPGTHLVAEGEEVQLLAQLAVVALLRLLQQDEVLLQFLLLGEGDGIQSGELLALLVAAPVGTGHAHHLGGLDEGGVGDVRSAAQVGETALAVEGDLAVVEAFDQFELVFVALLGEVGDRIGLGSLFPCEGRRSSCRPVPSSWLRWPRSRLRRWCARPGPCRSRSRSRWRGRCRTWCPGKGLPRPRPAGGHCCATAWPCLP